MSSLKTISTVVRTLASDAATASGDTLIEVWYQYFNQPPWAAQLVGSSREACRTFFKHFLDHWSGDNPSFRFAPLTSKIARFREAFHLVVIRLEIFGRGVACGSWGVASNGRCLAPNA
jgi:hypothetical protein